MDRRELLNDEQEALRMAMDGRLSSLWTALPGIVQEVDLAKGTCSVQPAIQARVQNQDGSFQYVNLPVLVDVPILFPKAGGFVLTLPLKADDEVLVIFSSRCIDSWWQNGGVGVPMELRMHDLSDGFALPGPSSQAKPISGVSEDAVQLRSEDGATYVEVSNSQVKVKATSAEVEAATITLKGNVEITGTLKIGNIQFENHKHSTSSNPSGVPLP